MSKLSKEQQMAIVKSLKEKRDIIIDENNLDKFFRVAEEMDKRIKMNEAENY